MPPFRVLNTHLSRILLPWHIRISSLTHNPERNSGNTMIKPLIANITNAQITPKTTNKGM